MKYLMLAVLLTFMQTAAPVQRKTVDNPAQPTVEIKSKPGPNQADAKESVATREPAPMSKAGKDAWEKAYVIFTGVLVAIGALGVRYAIRTLRAIERQADEMVNQRTVMHEQLATMGKQLAGLKSAERAWILLRPHNFYLEPSGRLDWAITNAGRSVATISEVGLRCKKCRGVEKLFSEPRKYTLIADFHDVPIAPQDSIEAWSGFEAAPGTDSLTPADVADIRHGDDLVAYDFVRYRDSFGDPHESRFCYYYAVAFNEFRINLRAPAEYHKCT